MSKNKKTKQSKTNSSTSTLKNVDSKGTNLTEVKPQEKNLTNVETTNSSADTSSAQEPQTSKTSVKKVNIKDKADQTIKAIEEANKTLKEVAKTAQDKTRKVAQNAKKATEAAIKAVAEDTATASKDTTDRLVKDSKVVIERAKETTATAKKEVEKITEETKSAVSKATKKAKESVKETTETAKKEVERIAEETKTAASKATKKANKTKESVKNTVKKVAEKITSVDAEKEFNTRFNSRYDELKWLYMERYDNMGYFNDLKDNIKNIYLYRDEKLKNLDREREKNPNWYKDNKIIGMSLYADLFADDLMGVADKIDYLKELDVNYLHIMPVFKTPDDMSDDGFSVSDFRNVSEKMGGNDALNHLISKCRENDINLCMDFVINHTSDQHDWAMKAKQGLPEYMGYYNFYDSYDIPSQFEKTLPQELPNSAPGNFTYIECINKHVMTTFNRYQWDLNFKNPVVFNEMVYNLLYLANIGCNVLNLNSIQYIWKDLNTDCRNLPQVHSILRMIRLITEIVCPGVILSGDVNMNAPYNTVYFGTSDKPELHLLYNEETMLTIWNTLAARDARMLKEKLLKLNSADNNQYYINYLRNYKDINWDINSETIENLGFDPFLHKKFLSEFLSGSFQDSFSRAELCDLNCSIESSGVCGTTASLCGLEKGIYEGDKNQINTAIDRILMAYSFITSLSGIPMIYSGDEIGQLNDYTYKDDTQRSSDVKNIYKSKFNWDNASKRNDNQTIEGKIFTGLKKIEDLRSNYKIFSGDAKIDLLDCNDIAVLLFKREFNGEKLICISNFSEWSKSISIEDDDSYVDLITNKTYKTNGEIDLNPYEFLWLYKKA